MHKKILIVGGALFAFAAACVPVALLLFPQTKISTAESELKVHVVPTRYRVSEFSDSCAEVYAAAAYVCKVNEWLRASGVPEEELLRFRIRGGVLYLTEREIKKSCADYEKFLDAFHDAMTFAEGFDEETETWAHRGFWAQPPGDFETFEELDSAVEDSFRYFRRQMEPSVFNFEDF